MTGYMYGLFFNDDGTLTNDFVERIVCMAVETNDGSVDEFLNKLLSHPTSLPENGNFLEVGVSKAYNINGQRYVLQFAASLLDS